MVEWSCYHDPLRLRLGFDDLFPRGTTPRQTPRSPYLLVDLFPQHLNTHSVHRCCKTRSALEKWPRFCAFRSSQPTFDTHGELLRLCVTTPNLDHLRYASANLCRPCAFPPGSHLPPYSRTRTPSLILSASSPSPFDSVSACLFVRANAPLLVLSALGSHLPP